MSRSYIECTLNEGRESVLLHLVDGLVPVFVVKGTRDFSEG